MKKVLLSLAAVSAIAVAAPAVAQPYGYVVRDYRLDQNSQRLAGQAINQRQAELNRRVDQAYRNGRITRVEANALMAELARIEVLDRRYRNNGRTFTQGERQEISNRLDRVQAQLRVDRIDGPRYSYGYGNSYSRW